jgi:hypothetical protein
MTLIVRPGGDARQPRLGGSEGDVTIVSDHGSRSQGLCPSATRRAARRGLRLPRLLANEFSEPPFSRLGNGCQ